MENIKNHAIKIQIGTALAVMLFIIVWSVKFGNMMSEFNETAEQVQRNKDRIIMLEENNHKIDIAIAEINVNIANICATLAEIKADLKIQWA